jgi:hypothetical protein
VIPVPEAVWRKGSRCGNGECVEVALEGGAVLVRNSRRPDNVLEFTLSEWAVFAQGMQAGEFDDLTEQIVGAVAPGS